MMRMYEVCSLFLICWMSVSETFKDPQQVITDTNHHGVIYLGKCGFTTYVMVKHHGFIRVYINKHHVAQTSGVANLGGILHPKMKILSSFTHLRNKKMIKQFFPLWESMGGKICLVLSIIPFSVFIRTKKFIQIWNNSKVTTDLASRETCASAPLAAGITALALKSNPSLTWRDVRYILIRVSRPVGLRREDWHPNGVFRLVSHYCGYGRLDADRLMGMGRNWRSVQFQKKCCRGVITRPSVLSGKFTLRWNKTACQGSENWIWSLEHVRLHLTLTNTRCALTISISAVRPLDWSYEGFHDWPFVHIQFWDKALAGYWVLQTESTNNLDRSELPSQVQMELYGTKKHMIHHRLRRHIVQNCEIKDQYGTCEVCAYPYYLYEKFCLVSCPPNHYEEEGNSSLPSRTCVPCHHTCNTCYGPLNTQCLTCPPYSTPDLNESTCNNREHTWERDRRRQEAQMWVILALFNISLFIFMMCAIAVSWIRYRNGDAQTEAVAMEMVERSDV